MALCRVFQNNYFTLGSLFLLVYNIADFAFNPPNKRGLYLDQEGILFQQTLLGRQVGKILWKDITDIQIQKNPL